MKRQAGFDGVRRRSARYLGLAALSVFALSFSDLFLANAQQLELDPVLRAKKPAATAGASHSVERYVPPGFLRQTPVPVGPTGSADAGMSQFAKPAPGAQPPIVTTNSAYSGEVPLTATVTHTLYLPPAMYGQWTVTGTLMETNAPDLFSPTVSDIWLLERAGNQVTVTNPVNGAFAAINVDKTEGDEATFHRSGTAGRHAIFQEIPTITVHGDRFSGQSLNKVQTIRDGQVTHEVYGVYHLEATRISAARTRFHPEAEQQHPDFQIEEVH